MATGDLKNNLRILNSELRKLNVPSNICNLAGMSAGNTDTFLDVFDNILQWHNPALSRLINSKGLKPPSKKENKTKFLESVYLIFREIFSWKPPLSVSQFLSNGFHEKKVIMCTELIRQVIQKIQELEPKSAKKQHLVDTGHSGLKVILKHPKRGIPPLKEKDMNVKSVIETCAEECGLLKDESCIYQHRMSEKSSGASVETPAENHIVPNCRENGNAEEIIDDRILTELLEFKSIVLGKFESLESRLSVTEKRINILENTLDCFKEKK